MTDKNEKRILSIIRYSSTIFIFVISLVIAYFINIEHKKNIKEEKDQIEKEFVLEERKRVEFITKKAYELLEKKDESKKELLKAKIRNHVLNAYKITMSIYENNKNTKSKEEITKLIKDALRDIRFLNGRGYFFIYKMDGTNVLNAAFPKLEGKSLWHYQDSKGVSLLQEMNKQLQIQDEVFYDWYWNKPNGKKDEYLKVGFFKKFGPYDWFIGTGEYMEDFTEELKEETLDIIKTLKYKNDGYLFVFEKNGLLLNTLQKDMIGINIHEVNLFDKLSKSFSSFMNSDDKGRFIQYEIHKNLEDKNPKNKISFMLKFDNWDWVIGSGFNIEEASSIVENRQKSLEEKYNRYLKNLIILSTIFLVFLLVISYLMSKYLEKIFTDYKCTLKNKNKNLLQAQKVAKLGDWKLDVENSELYWSEEIYRIFGVDKDKKIDLDYVVELINDEYKSYFKDSIKNTILNKTKHNAIYKIKRENDKKIRWIDCTGEFDEESNIVVGTIQDITDRKKLEIEKEQQEKILYQQSKMAAMGEMLSNIAHQWRQPLSTISTASTGIKLQKDMDILKDEDLIHAMDNINKSAQYLSQTIEDFRNFFNPKNNSFKEINLIDLIDRSLSLIDSQFKAKDIEIIKNIEDIDLFILENEFIQVLINILNNSRDALLLKGKNEKRLIFIESKRIKEKLELKIYDNANGIDLEIINRVFEPYFTTKHKSQGTGIGLYMSQEIITKLFKGYISVYNKTYVYKENVYKGACFKLELNINSKSKKIEERGI
ncbi:cache domain-containing protein [Halarcobacter bivalviorum]|uniref:histidine kinase n=1 Tax=Halarcobacter bivalviorum TaxID=663364 RepID=A0AAX2AAD5_9BACT|nr:cache domain-containing protein [Halarcobacter bivalviorum]AXH11168.1 multi-sensor domain-containing signal transduction histidine kinase [Halarcobacter bivalviorum]RXK09651.1 hypothetical protein CRV05_07895 [Halarcobacter bivalviorum]